MALEKIQKTVPPTTFFLSSTLHLLSLPPPSLSLSLLPSLHPLIPHIHTLFSHPLSLASPHVHLLCLISQVPGCVFGKLDGVIKQVLVFWELSSSVEQGWVGGGISGLVLGNHCVNQTKILKPYKFSDI